VAVPVKGSPTCQMSTLPETQLEHAPLLCTFTQYSEMHTYHGRDYEKDMSVAMNSSDHPASGSICNMFHRCQGVESVSGSAGIGVLGDAGS